MFTSTYTLDAHEQIDGRRYVRERHVEADGTEHVFDYLAAVGTDYDAVLAEHAAQLAQSLADAEYAQQTEGE